jgi:CHAD domain-containing protein
MGKAKDVPGLRPDTPFREAARATVRVRAQELFEHSANVLDTEDIERVHDMRVATRRLRAVLEVYAPCFDPKQLKPVLRDVKALADALGERRDPDVQLAALQDFAAAVPEADWPGIDAFADRIRAEQATGNRTLADALARAEEHDLRGRLEVLAGELTVEDPASVEVVGEPPAAAWPAWEEAS